MLALVCVTSSLFLSGQTRPDWLDEEWRNMRFSSETYLVGFACNEFLHGTSLQDAMQKAKIGAQTDLSQKIYVRISSVLQNEIMATSSDGQYSEKEYFFNQSVLESNAEVVGMKTELYYDSQTKLVYALAYANKHELIGYHKNSLVMTILQIEEFLKTARILESSGEKAKSRQQCNATNNLFDKARYVQNLLVALNADITKEELHQQKTEQLYHELVQMAARLSQGVFVYIKNDENLLGISVDIVANKLKGVLAKEGCSFVDDEQQADFIIKLNVSTRTIGNENAVPVFCYGDVVVELYCNHKQKVIYHDELSQKGGSNSYERAGRKAFENVAAVIAERIKPWIN